MRSRAVWFISRAIWSLAVVLILGFMVFSASIRGADVSGGYGLVLDILFGIALLGIVTLGVLVSNRRPGNPVGWIITGGGLSLMLSGFAEGYGVYALFADPGSLPGGEVMAWISSWIGIPSLFATPALLFLLFPDGHLVGRRWLIVLWLVVTATCSAMVDAALNPVLDDAPFKGVASPLDIETSGTLLTLLSLIGWPGMTAGLLASAPAMILRLRHSRGIQRQQLKWIASAAAVVPIASLVGVISYYLGREELGTISALAASLLIPFAAGYAVLRHRLYDIDVVINRALVYGSLTLMLALVYFGGVTATQALFRTLTSQEQQPQPDMCRLHRLPHNAHQVVA